MKRQLLSAIFLSVLILSGLLSLPSEFRVAGATAIVYIRADGSVDPSTAPIQRVQDVYTFYRDVNSSLVAQRDSIIIDGAGHTLRGGENRIGVDLSGRSNVTVKNLGIAAFQNGIYLSFSYNNTLLDNNITANTDYGVQSDFWDGCSGNVIIGNSITGNGGTGNGGGILINPASSYTSIIDNYVATNNPDGIHFYASAYDVLYGNNVTANKGIGINLDTSSNTTLRNNNMARNSYNFAVEAYFMDWFVSYDIDTSNMVDGKPIYYWVDKHGVAVPSDAGYVALVNSSDVTVRGLNLTNNGQGVALFNTENCTITQNNIANNLFGLRFASSNNNTVSHNNLTNDDYYVMQSSSSSFIDFSYNNVTCNVPSSVDLEGGSSDVTIRYNNFTNCGVEFLGGENNDVSFNNMTIGGVALTSNSNATVSYNKITNSGSGIGIYMDCSNSIAWHNDIEEGDVGIYLNGGSGNTVSYNTLTNNSEGFEFDYSSNNNIVSNNDVIGSQVGAFLKFDDTGNTFYHNNFINNTHSVETAFAQANAWDAGYPSGGNYWGDYSGTDVHSGPSQNMTGSDGLGDMAYVIDPNNVDNYPLMKPYAGPHDLGISVSLSKTVVLEGYNRTISMNVTVINYGVQAETFNFTSQIGSALQEQTVALTQRNSTLLVLSFNVTGWGKGNYTLYCQALPVPDETDTSDNTYQGLFVVSILGDINGDCKVDMKDVGYVARRFQIGPTSLLWNPNADINDDLKIDMKDIGTVARHFGESWL
jgi:parallel beta-helix repeat protein